MPRRPALTSLPQNLQMGLLLLERGHALRNGGKVVTGRLPEKVLDFFNRLEQAGIDWVMVGAEAVNLYLKRPRATMDVDIVVRTAHVRRVKKIVRDMCEVMKDTEVHFKALLSPDPMRLELDVIKSQSHELFEAALENQVVREGVRVPRVEALLALKYLSAVSPWRARSDKLQDITDFMRAYRDNQSRIDRQLLIDLASRAHKGARKEFEHFLDAIEKNKPITI